MSGIKIRKYLQGDEVGISKLLDENTQYVRDLNFWVWINRILPVDDSIVAVAEFNNEIIGHYAILPFNVIDNDKTLKVGLGIHAFVHPEYRDKVSIFSISSQAYKIGKQMEIDFLIGFPNKNYRLIQEKIERWDRIGLFNALELKFIHSSNDTSFDWAEIQIGSANVFAHIQLLIDRQVSNDGLIKFKHDLNFLIKRYFVHPQSLYRFFFIKRDNNIEGFLVLKVFKSEDEYRLHIVEMILPKKEYVEEVILDLQRLEFLRKTRKIVLWPENEGRKSDLQKIGFSATGFDTFVGLKRLNTDLDYTKYLQLENWHLSMGDSDAF